MYNLLSALLIVVVAVTGVREGFVPNQLYHLGLLLLLGYLLGLAADRIRLPAVLGYIAAGCIAGPGGAGLIGDRFLGNMEFLTAYLTMILLVESAAVMCRASGRFAVRYLLAGAVASLLVFGAAVLMLTPVTSSLAARAGLALFAAAFSPLAMDALHGNRADVRHHLVAYGGLAMTVTAWGIAIALLGPANPQRLRLAFMPSFIALTSAVCGYALGLAAFALAGGTSLSRSRLYMAAMLFIAYPLIGELGLDYVFLAIGYGVFNGIVWKKESAGAISPIVSIGVFVMFGLSLAVDSMISMNAVEWKLAALLTTVIILGRSLILAGLSLIAKHAGGLPLSPVPLLPAGPIALILILRFLPGLQESATGADNQYMFLTICTASICIVLIITTIRIWSGQALASRANRRLRTKQDS